MHYAPDGRAIARAEREALKCRLGRARHELVDERQALHRIAEDERAQLEKERAQARRTLARERDELRRLKSDRFDRDMEIIDLNYELQCRRIALERERLTKQPEPERDEVALSGGLQRTEPQRPESLTGLQRSRPPKSEQRPRSPVLATFQVVEPQAAPATSPRRNSTPYDPDPPSPPRTESLQPPSDFPSRPVRAPQATTQFEQQPRFRAPTMPPAVEPQTNLIATAYDPAFEPQRSPAASCDPAPASPPHSELFYSNNAFATCSTRAAQAAATHCPPTSGTPALPPSSTSYQSVAPHH